MSSSTSTCSVAAQGLGGSTSCRDEDGAGSRTARAKRLVHFLGKERNDFNRVNHACDGLVAGPADGGPAVWCLTGLD